MVVNLKGTTEQLSANYTTFNDELKRIRSDGRLSAEGKTQALTALWAKHRAVYQRLTSELTEGITSEGTTLEAAAFAAPSAGRRPTAEEALNYRDALRDAEAAQAAKTLTDLVGRAVLCSDGALIRACGAVAYMAGETQLMDAVGRFDSAIAELAAFEHAHGKLSNRAMNSLQLQMYGPERPAEVPLTVKP